MVDRRPFELVGMKKEITTHGVFLIAFFLLITVFRGWFALEYIPFWLGGILGTLLADTDHLIYIYFLRPKEKVSQDVSQMIGESRLKDGLDTLAQTRSQRKELIFHTLFFQLLFLVFTFLVATSSGSVFGQGIVLAFSLHLLVDQYVDVTEKGNIDNWFKYINISFDASTAKRYMIVILVLLLIIGVLF